MPDTKPTTVPMTVGVAGTSNWVTDYQSSRDFESSFTPELSLKESKQKTSMRADVFETDYAYFVDVDLPGVEKKDIQVSVQGSRVSVSATRQEKTAEKVIRREIHYGNEFRCFQFPQDIDVETATAEYQHGVLNIILPKKSGSRERLYDVQVKQLNSTDQESVLNRLPAWVKNKQATEVLCLTRALLWAAFNNGIPAHPEEYYSGAILSALLSEAESN